MEKSKGKEEKMGMKGLSTSHREAGKAACKPTFDARGKTLIP